MFIGQLLKILLFAAFIYMLYNLVRFLFRAGRVLHDKRMDEETTSRQRTSVMSERVPGIEKTQ